ncbi:MAG: hypothetical protein K2O40_14240, partial [Lachnospiraceae bacterium]|nr:hypothetical protein [Lachnospiraceae bacterium]
MTTLRVSWLLHIVSVMGAYQNGQELHLVLNIFGIPFFDTLRNKKAKSTKTKEKPTGEIQAASSDEDCNKYWGSEEDSAKEYEQFEVDWDDDSNVAAIQPDPEKDSTVKKLNIIQKIKDFFIKFVNFFKKIKFTFDKVCD